MKSFQAIQKNFAVLGIDRNQSKSHKNVVMTWLTLCLATIFSATFFALKAHTFEEYITNIYTTSAGAMIVTILTILIFEVESLFVLINIIEKTIDESELVLSSLFQYLRALLEYGVQSLRCHANWNY